MKLVPTYMEFAAVELENLVISCFCLGGFGFASEELWIHWRCRGKVMKVMEMHSFGRDGSVGC